MGQYSYMNYNFRKLEKYRRKCRIVENKVVQTVWFFFYVSFLRSIFDRRKFSTFLRFLRHFSQTLFFLFVKFSTFLRFSTTFYKTNYSIENSISKKGSWKNLIKKFEEIWQRIIRCVGIPWFPSRSNRPLSCILRGVS